MEFIIFAAGAAALVIVGYVVFKRNKGGSGSGVGGGSGSGKNAEK